MDTPWHEIRRTGRLAERRVHYLPTCESTNTLALELAAAGEPAGTVLVAETQTGGRGRLGKRWQSPVGTGLYCTVLLRPLLPLAQLPRLTLAAGLAVAQAIDEAGSVVSAIKWPNDVLISGRKVAGVLAECAVHGPEPSVALGIGINLTTDQGQWSPEVQERATSLLLASGKAVDRGTMLATLLQWIEREMARLEQGEFAEILAEWRRKDATAGHRLTWLTQDGQAVSGVSLGPDHEGLLVIRDEIGRYHHVLSGDITLDPNRLNGYFP